MVKVIGTIFSKRIYMDAHENGYPYGFTSFLCNGLRSLTGVLYRNSIFAANNESISQSAARNKNQSWTQQFKLGLVNGVETGTIGIVSSIIIASSIAYMNPSMTKSIVPTENLIDVSSLTGLKVLVVSVISEEILYGTMQSALGVIQNEIRYQAPDNLQNNRVFQFITSPSARALIVNSLFAIDHFRVNNSAFGTPGLISQATLIFFRPNLAILRETTGNFIAPIGSHLAHNAILTAVLDCICWARK